MSEPPTAAGLGVLIGAILVVVLIDVPTLIFLAPFPTAVGSLVGVSIDKAPAAAM